MTEENKELSLDDLAKAIEELERRIASNDLMFRSHEHKADGSIVFRG